MQPSSVGACAFLAPHSASCSNCRTQGTHWWWWHCSREASGVGVAILPRWIVELAVRAAGCCNIWSLNFRLVSTHSHLLWCLTESTWFSSVNNHPVYLSTRKAKTMFLFFYYFVDGIKLLNAICRLYVILPCVFWWCNLSFFDGLCVTEPRRTHAGRGRVEHHFVLIQLEGTSPPLFYFFQTLNG